MFDQGRFTKVMAALLASMVGGALFLLALEGKPIKPMAYSLSSQTHLAAPAQALFTENGIAANRWLTIEIGFRPNDGQLIKHGEDLHLLGDFAVGYHFIISDGSTGDDGQILATTRWTQQLTCFPQRSAEDERTIKICLIGDPSNPLQTPSQARNLDKLVTNLMRHCNGQMAINWRN